MHSRLCRISETGIGITIPNNLPKLQMPKFSILWVYVWPTPKCLIKSSFPWAFPLARYILTTLHYINVRKNPWRPFNFVYISSWGQVVLENLIFPWVSCPVTITGIKITISDKKKILTCMRTPIFGSSAFKTENDIAYQPIARLIRKTQSWTYRVMNKITIINKRQMSR